MKKLFASLAAIAIISAATPAFAATYQSSTSYDGSKWIVKWSVLAGSCSSGRISAALDSGALVLKVDGVQSTYHTRTTSTAIPLETTVSFNGIVGGNDLSITVDGRSSFVCGGNTYLLPGHVTPPAAIPTMSEWAMIFMGGLMALGAAVFLQRRRNDTRPS